MLKKVIALLALCACFSQAHAWWSSDWKYRKELILDSSVTGFQVKNLISQPVVLVRLHIGNFPYFSETAVDGNDIRFVADDDRSLLAYEVERYDPARGLGLFWVRVPQYQPEKRVQKIYMYYGADDVTAAARRTNVYSTNDVLVYHFEKPGFDSSRYHNSASLMTAKIVDHAIIGRGARFIGNSVMQIPQTDALAFNPQQGMTVSFWVKPSARQDAVLYQYRFENGDRLSLAIIQHQPVLQWKTRDNELVGTVGNEKSVIETNQWMQLAFTVDEEKCTLYVNGEAVAQLHVNIPGGSGTTNIGMSADGGLGFTGDMDEFRVVNKPMGSDWIRLLATNQKLESRLIRSGEDREQIYRDMHPNYIAYSISRLTVEGRFTVIVLLVLFVFAMSVMIAKMWFIYKVRKENKLFQHHFSVKNLSAGLNSAAATALVSERMPKENMHLNHSTLYSLYQLGMSELGKRLSTASTLESHSATPLALASITAIRTTMEAAMAHQMQRLQKQMVFLTIAISGGPFIGLLGTVIGVMITFAEVAQVGSVDVNAIAPGIAAALVATVAGLLVAIPSLFGYNYLSAKIKEIVVDMRVFVDEFEAFVAEKYGCQ